MSKISPYRLNGQLEVADRRRSLSLRILALVAMTADEPVLAGRRRLMEECGDGCRVREEAA
ncbi:hypothetical protein AB0F43_36755 [Kribbella sp. NPDC023972]|uniref:hypothetical protein n=1 Tax=Kribbella sp. NPDC023972 TaxID=3154795 RepID=UPI0033EE5E5F